MFCHQPPSFSPSLLPSLPEDFRNKIRSLYGLFSLIRKNTQPVWSFVRNVPSVLPSWGHFLDLVITSLSVISRTPIPDPFSSSLSAMGQQSTAFNLPRPQTLMPTLSLSPSLSSLISLLYYLASQIFLLFRARPGHTLSPRLCICGFLFLECSPYLLQIFAQISPLGGLP